MPAVFDKFSECVMSEAAGLGSWTPTGETGEIGRDVPTAKDIRAAWVPAAERVGLVLGKATGQSMVMADRSVRSLRRLYTMAEAADVLGSAVAIVEDIAKRHGPGRVWFSAEPCLLVRRAQQPGTVPYRAMGYMKSDLDANTAPGGPNDEFIHTGARDRRVVMGCYYFHEGAK